MEQLYTLKEVSKMLNISYITLYKRVNKCKSCKNLFNKCRCGEFNPQIKAININDGERVTWRVPKSEIDRILRRIRK